MPSVYLVDVIGDGLDTTTAFRPSGFDGVHYVSLMIDPVRQRAVVVSPDDTVSTPGVRQLLTAGSWPQLRSRAAATSPSTTQLDAVKTWLTDAGYPVPASQSPTWLQVILYVARLGNPDADLNISIVT